MNELQYFDEEMISESLNQRITTGFTGVSWFKKTGKFEAYVHTKGKKYHVGMYDDPYAAARARITWMKDHGIDGTSNKQKTHEENQIQQPNTVMQIPLQEERKENTMIEQKLAELQDTTIEWLPVNLLSVDPSYQRPAGPKKIKAISDSFNLAAAGVLLVSLRSNGQYFVMDGQHRLEAMKKLNIQWVECKVYRGLSAKEEAETFIFCNLVRKNPTAIDVFKARLFTEDSIAVEIKKIVEKYGLVIVSTNTPKRTPKEIRAIAAIEEVYTRYGAQFLEDILILLTRTWDGELNAFDTTIIEGITDFHLKYQAIYSREEFIRKVGITDPRTILRRASYLKENYGEAMYKGVSRALQEAYDKGRRNRLPDRLQQLEDK